jgi:hypothetical protein
MNDRFAFIVRDRTNRQSFTRTGHETHPLDILVVGYFWFCCHAACFMRRGRMSC